MSASPTARRTAVASVAAVSASVLLGLAPAAADPPGVDVDWCSPTLSKVAHWPGGIGDGSTRFSDAYESYLLRQPVCRPVP